MNFPRFRGATRGLPLQKSVKIILVFQLIWTNCQVGQNGFYGSRDSSEYCDEAKRERQTLERPEPPFGAAWRRISTSTGGLPGDAEGIAICRRERAGSFELSYFTADLRAVLHSFNIYLNRDPNADWDGCRLARICDYCRSESF